MERHTRAASHLSDAQRRRAMGLLFGVLLLIMLGFSVLFPIEPYYVREFGANSGTMGMLVGIYSGMQFLFAPVWGRLSDRIGRRPVLMLGLLGFVVSQTLFGLATELWMLFAARTLAGILSAAALPTAMAYIADITPPEDRAKGMGLLGAAFGLGVVIGPAVGGVLGAIALSLPFFVSAGIAALTLTGVYFILPESLPPEAREAAAGARRHTSRWAGFDREMTALYGVTLALSLGMAGIEVTFGFFAADRLGLDTRGVGLVFMVMGIAMSFVQGFLVGRMQRRLGESRMTLIGLALGALAMVLVTMVHQISGAVLAISLLAVGVGIARPANSALISRRARTGQGVAIGVMDSFDSLGRIGGPLLGGYLYKAGITLPYVSGAALFTVALLLAGLWSARLPAPQAAAEGTGRR